MVRNTVTLNDKYTEESGRIYLSGLQALVRIPIIQRQLDQKNDKNTATFISGYRGSPIGALDMELGRAKKILDEYNIRFHPGINEDLAATSVWGTQQVNLGPGAQYDGVTGIWYGKGPGVDRSCDVIKHANAAGTSANGGVLALAGDDHACKSSTFPHQSEQAFMHCMVPVLHPTDVADALELGLHGIAMSRYSGCWSAMKIVTDFADCSSSIFTDPFAMEFKTPEDFELPLGGLNIRWYDVPVEQEERLIRYKLPAAKAYARANGLDKTILMPTKKKRLGLVSTGKAYMDTRQALSKLGIDEAAAEKLGIALYKVALVWPMEEQGLLNFADGLDEIVVIEEKRGVMEDQIKKILYHMPAKKRPIVTGKHDETGTPLLPETFELAPAQIAQVIIKRLNMHVKNATSDFEDHLNALLEPYNRKSQASDVVRMPYYCSGCPHNSSTVVPEGSRALAGIGCHYMAMWMDRETYMFSQMGGEGVPWIGQAPFTSEKHVFVNLGDGTYFHSGLLAIRASVAGNVNITYKILYNDAVAMTGGQPIDGTLTVEQIAQQVTAEGVQHLVIMSDEPEKYGSQANFPIHTQIKHRDDIDQTQREMRELSGVSVLVYDQTCAAEKRRRRKRGLMEDPAKRIYINEQVCEGCGDCGKVSNCLSLRPMETDYGRKRQIDQSSCNKDYSCVKGFCPSFVTIEGGDLKKPATISNDDTGSDNAKDDLFINLPTPKLSDLKQPFTILVTGIGGTGVVTIGALLAMAAHLEDKGSTTMDQTGLAQKGGSVTSHIHIAKRPEDIHTVRIGSGQADVIIGCDLLVTANADTMSKIKSNSTQIFLNSFETPTGAFTKDTEWKVPSDDMIVQLRGLCGDKNVDVLDATRLATRLLGNSIATNMFMLGYVWQKGQVPVSEEALMKAIELNNVAIDMNQQSFKWGRLAAHDLQTVIDAATSVRDDADGQGPDYAYRTKSKTIDELIERRATDLKKYQNKAYANQYLSLVNKVRNADKDFADHDEVLTAAVAKYAFKLMAYKDEYEVARLYTDGEFLKQVAQKFDGNYKIKFNLAPPLLAKRDPVTGHLRKSEFGPWILTAFKVLAKMKFLRGTFFDVFGKTDERQMERELISEYTKAIDEILESLSNENYDAAVQIANLPEKVRGYGHVKEEHVEKVMAEWACLLEAFHNPKPKKKVA